MSATLQRVSDDRWRLTGRLDFETVPELRPRIREALRPSERVTLDLSGVTHTNSAGVALVIQWLEDARKDGASIEVINPPQAFSELAGLSNIESLLAS